MIDSAITFIGLHLPAFISFIIAVIYICLAVGTTIHILLNKDDVRSSIGWIAIVFLSPFIGTVLYVFLGINRVRRKAAKLRRSGSLLKKFSKEKLEELYESLPVHSKQYINFGRSVYPQSFSTGNSIEPLQNGTQAYPEMIEAIKNAKKEVLVESYIFDYDTETEKFIEAFKIAIKNGASVKVIIDGIGTLHLFRRSIEKKLEEIEGLQFGVFLPPQIPIAIPFVNLRLHRKIMIIDGETAFFGGMNLSVKNTMTDNLDKGIIDVTFKVQGPIIDQMSQVFEDDWQFCTGKKMRGCSQFAENREVGKIPARIIPDCPDNNQGKIELMVHAMINGAMKKILIVTPYFLPESNILTALEMAAMKGVNIEIILPGLCDHTFMDWAMEPNYLKLIEKGVKIYHTPRPFDHSKFFVVDDEWVFIGSANWDVRSFRLHFESNMEVISKELAKQLTDIAEKKKEIAALIQEEHCRNLHFFKRLRNNAFRLLTPYY